MNEQINQIVNWLRKSVKEARVDGLLVGVSGGLDSAVVAHLIQRAFPEDSLGVIMPVQTHESDLVDAQAVIDTAGIKGLTVDLTATHSALLEEINSAIPPVELSEERGRLADANLRARLRMGTLYTVATNYNYLVVGTDNQSEWYTGYFTKYGDGGVDLLPVVSFTKSEVYEMAHVLGVPEAVITKPPSADLWEGQTDEEEMGTTYTEIDAYLRDEPIPDADREKIESMHTRTNHKRAIPKQYIK